MKTKYAPMVQLDQGLVRGIVQEVDDGEIYLYQGVPYGRAGRFEKPQPADKWEGVFDATQPRVNPPQLGLEIPSKGYYTQAYSEDCLQLNVWKPIEEGSNRAVMVYLFGGGFKTGSIHKITHDARYISKRGDVIVVMMSYRLGAFGFLYGGDDVAPANLGLHDQILGLQWVQENIEKFGGDKNNVTIFGNSAGSVSVGIHLLSPLSKGLFHRAILQSGVPDRIRPKEEHRSKTRLLAKALGCNSLQMKDIIACLKTKSVEEILNASKELDDPFGPVYGDELMPLRPVEALKTGQYNADIDILYGVVRDEGGAFAASKIAEIDDDNVQLTLQLTKEYLVKLMGDPFGALAFDFYRKRVKLSAEPTLNELRELINRAYGDYIMIMGVILFGEHFARRSPPSRRNYSWMLMRPAAVHIAGMCNGREWMGVGHADELYYLFTIGRQTSAEDKQLSFDICRSWAQFAKTGNPGPVGGVEWTQAIDADNCSTRFMALDYKSQMVSGHFVEICDFWVPKLFV